MKTIVYIYVAIATVMMISSVSAFVPSSIPSVLQSRSTDTVATKHTNLFMAKYKSMDEILALFPEDKPILINFYDAKTEDDIKADIMRAKQLLADRATVVSIKQQDYPELSKLWDADKKSPSMILFKDGQPVTRLYEETHYLEIVARIGQFCKETV
jgi:hypothetical protein